MKIPVPSLVLLYLLLTGFLPACNSEDNTSAAENLQASESDLQYAQQFRIHNEGAYVLLEVLKPYPGAQKSQRYAIVKEGKRLPDSVRVDAQVQLPVKCMVAISTSHLPALDLLGVSDRLVGFPNLGLISSEKQRKRIAAGALQELGSGPSPNIERILALKPELILAYGMQPDDNNLEILKRSGIPVLLNADYLETTPLGRAEWLKFTAELFDKRAEADSIFQHIVNTYDSLASLAAAAKSRPSIFSGVIYGDAWYVPGGKSWAAQFFADAGGHYLWSENGESGSLALSPEVVLAEAQDARFWLNAANFSSLSALAAADERYTLFEAWQQGLVYTYTARQTKGGGNAYLEEGYARPDLILADLIKILHPELLPQHELYFYQKLGK